MQSDVIGLHGSRSPRHNRIYKLKSRFFGPRKNLTRTRLSRRRTDPTSVSRKCDVEEERAEMERYVPIPEDRGSRRRKSAVWQSGTGPWGQMKCFQACRLLSCETPTFKCHACILRKRRTRVFLLWRLAISQRLKLTEKKKIMMKMQHQSTSGAHNCLRPGIYQDDFKRHARKATDRWKGNTEETKLTYS